VRGCFRNPQVIETVISLMSDDFVLVGEFAAPSEQGSTLKYRFRGTMGRDWLYSRWTSLTEAGAELKLMVDALKDVEERWAAVGPQTQSEFFKMRQGTPSKFPLPPEVFERAKTWFDTLITSRVALTTALLKRTRADAYCEVAPENGPGLMKYVTRNGKLWASRRTLTRQQWAFLIDTAEERDKIALEALTTPASEANGGKADRSIPLAIRHEVWRRDQGKCVRCGSDQRLEFDHIIPVAMGGSSTARNVQLLCENCNRSKGATLG
jgi:hypothetical protein